MPAGCWRYLGESSTADSINFDNDVVSSTCYDYALGVVNFDWFAEAAPSSADLERRFSFVCCFFFLSPSDPMIVGFSGSPDSGRRRPTSTSTSTSDDFFEILGG